MVTAAPQMTFTGSQYLELRYQSTTLDAIGVSAQSNSSVLGNVSLYRKNTINQPNSLFNISEWDQHPSNYCQNLGTLSVSENHTVQNDEYTIYPNPVFDHIYAEGKVENVKEAQILNFSGKLIYTEKHPFKNKKSISVHSLNSGSYILILDTEVYPFIKK